VVSVGEPEALISREEVVGMLFNIADIAAEAWLIRRFSRTTVKRKRTKEEIERLRREAQNRPNVRRLRQLAERAQAELEARRRNEASENA
jgi:hypothetical protein